MHSLLALPRAAYYGMERFLQSGGKNYEVAYLLTSYVYAVHFPF